MIKKGIILSGGKGTRLEPFTSVLPKPLIPIENKTILEHIIYQFQTRDEKKQLERYGIFPFESGIRIAS